MTSIKRSFVSSTQIPKLKSKIILLEKALENMRQTDSAKNKFLANMAHELRTPLNTIIGFSQILSRDTNLTSQQNEYMSLIMQSSDHLISLIDDILQFSKLESGNFILKPSEFDFYELLESLDSIYYAKATEKGLIFNLKIADNTPRYLYADKNKIRQILINLLSNAIKFTEVGTITLSVKLISEIENNAMRNLEMLVTDTGSGIKEEEISQLFEPYQQTTSGRESNTGNGLGLVITRELVQLMNGDIKVESEWDKGTTFVVTIEAEEIEANAIFEPYPRKVERIVSDQESHRILVVDDKPNNRTLLENLLTNVGFEVETVENGIQALNKCIDWMPQLIFMDMRMPHMDGYETTRQIRQMPWGNSIRIIALTASSFQHEIDAISEAGCDDLILKPFRNTELFRKIGKQLNVNFIYDDDSAITQEAKRVEKPIKIACIPDMLKQRLFTAVENYSFDQVQAVLADFPLEYQQVAEALQRKVNDFDFAGILQLLNKKETTV